MNVLPDKESGSSGGGGGGGGGAAAGGGGGLDAANAGILDDIFGDLGGKIKEASIWAKILAAILAGIITTWAIGNIIDSFERWQKRIGYVADGIKSIGTHIDDMKKKWDESMKAMGKSYENGLLKGTEDGSKLKTAGSNIAHGLISGISGALGGMATKLWPVLVTALAPIGAAIGAAVTAGAAALGVSVGAFIAIIAAVVAVIIGIIWVVWKNWDTIWAWVKEAASTVWGWMKTAWGGMKSVFVTVFEALATAANWVWGVLTAVFNAVVTVITPFIIILENIGKVFAWIAQLIFTLFVVAIMAIAVAALWVWNKIQEGAAWLWGKIQEGINAVIGFFQMLWDKIQLGIDTVIEFFQMLWTKITEIFSVVTSWFAEQFRQAWESIKNIWSVVSTWFMNSVWTPIVNIFTPVVAWFGGVFKKAWESIKSALAPFTAFIQGLWDSMVGIFGKVGDWFVGRFNDMVDRVRGVFDTFKSLFQDAWDFVGRVFSGIGNFITSGLRGAINGVFSGIERVANTIAGFVNGLLDKFNKVSPVNIPRMGTLSLTRLARGGIVNQPTLAMVGEAGSEAVVPLENNTEWIEKLAAKINSSTGGGQPMQLTIQIGEERIASKLIDLINEKTQMSGRNAIYV